MKNEDRTYIMYLEDMTISMQRIIDYTEGMDYDIFKNDHKTFDAVIRNFEIIGEASKNLPNLVIELYPDIPWLQMYSLRNRVSHAYFGIDYEIIWEIITNDIANNLEQVIDVLNTENKK